MRNHQAKRGVVRARERLSRSPGLLPNRSRSALKLPSSNDTIHFNLKLSADAVEKINGALADKQLSQAIVLNVDIEDAQEPTGVDYEVYVDLPENQTPSFGSIYYAGNLGLFLPRGAGMRRGSNLSRPFEP